MVAVKTSRHDLLNAIDVSTSRGEPATVDVLVLDLQATKVDVVQVAADARRAGLVDIVKQPNGRAAYVLTREGGMALADGPERSG